MRTVLPIFLVLLLQACSDSSGGYDGGASSSSSSDEDSQASQDIIDENFPRVAYSEVAGLHTLADFPIGMEVSAADQERSIFTLTEQQPVLGHHFDSLVAGVIMKMAYLHPEEDGEGEFYFDDADELVDYAVAQGMTMHGHTLIWHWPTQIPDWMRSLDGGRDEWNAMMHNHVFQIVKHFEGRVDSWDVVNEAVDVVDGVDGYRDTIFFQNMGEQYIENAFSSAHEADPEADLYYNDFGLSRNGAKFRFTMDMINDFLQRDIPIDGIGFQMHITLDGPSQAQMQSAFETAAATELKIRISELDIAINARSTRPPSDWEPSTSLTADLALEQKRRYKEVVQAYMEAVPADQRGGITVWGLVDGETWMRPARDTEYEWPLMFHDDYTVKPAYYGFAEALTGQ